MQTFVPNVRMHLSVQCLDNRRLGKQRVEAWQILNTLRNGGGWSNHPAVRMWEFHEAALAYYGLLCCIEWKARGFQDTMLPQFLPHALPPMELPKWWGDQRMHRSHRSNLLRKDPQHYSRLWNDPDDLPYFWPTKEGY